MEISELALNRQATEMFIAADPTVVSLIPNGKIAQASGGFIRNDLPPKPPQTFKIISQSDTDGRQSTDDGGVYKRDYVLVAKHDADIVIGDSWESDGVFWLVKGFLAYNGYERKANVVATGAGMADG